MHKMTGCLHYNLLVATQFLELVRKQGQVLYTVASQEQIWLRDVAAAHQIRACTPDLLVSNPELYLLKIRATLGIIHQLKHTSAMNDHHVKVQQCSNPSNGTGTCTLTLF